MRKIFILLMSIFALSNVGANPEVKVYSNGDYGLALDGTISLNNSLEDIPKYTIVDEDGSLYMLASFKGGILPTGEKLPSSYTNAILKFSPEGKCEWAQTIYDARKLMEFNGELLVTVWAEKEGFTYDGVTRKAQVGYSEFLLKISKENGKVLSEFELEVDNVITQAPRSFPFALSNHCGFTQSSDGDLWFMLDVNPDFDRLNKETPVSIKRFGDNDKCLIRLTSDLKFKQAIGIGSDSNDEVDFLKGESPDLVHNLYFKGDTLFCHITFGGDEINISFDEEKPVIVKRKTGWRCVASAAFCKYLLKGDKLELLSYRVINEKDDQAKRFFVDSKNRLIVSVPKTIWDEGEETFYTVNSDMTFQELEGYAYHPVRNTGRQKALRLDRHFNILKFEDFDFEEREYSNDIEALPNPGDFTFRCAKYDKEEKLHWVFEFPSLDDYPYTPECNVDPERGYLYLCFYADVDVDIDMSEKSDVKHNERIIARYIETYKVKTSSENASITVNGGNDMVRHGADAEIVATAKPGYHIEKITTSKGDNVDFTWDGHCTIKNVTEPIDLIVATAEGEASVEQQDAITLEVYPNPVREMLNVDDAEDALYEILDMTGKSLCSGNINNGSIDVKHLPKGMYVLTIQKEIGAYSTKIVKE